MLDVNGCLGSGGKEKKTKIGEDTPLGIITVAMRLEGSSAHTSFDACATIQIKIVEGMVPWWLPESPPCAQQGACPGLLL